MRSIVHSFKNNVDLTEVELRVFLLNVCDIMRSEYEIVIICIVLITSAFISLIIY